MKLSFTQAKKEEFAEIKAFYWQLIEIMQAESAVIGWKRGIYPTDAFLQRSGSRALYEHGLSICGG